MAAILALILSWPCAASAQLSEPTMKYKVDYVNESRLFRNGKHITLLHINLEWPSILGYSRLPALQAFLSKTIFGAEAPTLRSGMEAYFKTLGKEIHVMPEEEGLEVEYRTMVVRELAWEKDRFVSLVVAKQRRMSDEVEADIRKNILLTYDIAKDKIMRTPDIIRRNYQAGRVYSEALIDRIWTYMPKQGIEVRAIDLPDECCLLQGKVGVAFNMKGNSDGDIIEHLVVVPYTAMDGILTNKAYNVRNANNKFTPPVSPQPEETVDDSLKVYLMADEMPQFQGGEKALAQFVSGQLNFPAYEQLIGVEGKTIVSFVIDRDGQVTEPSVISPVSPGIDREAVRVINAMPKWTPGMDNGKPVRVKVTMPLIFKLER